MPLKGIVSAQNALQGSETEIRELHGGIHVFSVKQNSGTENFQTEHCRKEHLGTRKFQEYQFVMEFEKLFLEKIPGFYFEQGRKFQDF